MGSSHLLFERRLGFFWEEKQQRNPNAAPEKRKDRNRERTESSSSLCLLCVLCDDEKENEKL